MENIKSDDDKTQIDLVESETLKLDDFLKEKLQNAFYKQTSGGILHDIVKIATEHSAIDLAYAAAHLPFHARPILYDNLPSRDAKINFIINTTPETRLIIFRYMNENEVKKLFDKMPADEALFILDDMSERRFKRVMELINPQKAKKIQEQKKHSRNSAGRLMTSEFFAFDMDKTLKDAKDYIQVHPRIDFTKGIFILNKNKKLKGYVPARNMLVNAEIATLKQIMRPILHKAFAETKRAQIIDLFERYKLLFLAVVDKNEQLIGVISQEDVLEAMEDVADETFAKISGTYENVSFEDPILKRFLARSPWLIVTLIAGLINVGIISSFQQKEGSLLTFVLFFVPLITGMSGNIGIQCSTVLVRSLAFGLVSKRTKKEAILKELYTGITT
ncbi:MAG: Magnesium transporter MgtE, partial [Candidatus Anoxychlamydiales bacterium]|nr:Magnesium transporter MgtE [Candidatus Anoxychlamydiales bacterium]